VRKSPQRDQGKRRKDLLGEASSSGSGTHWREEGKPGGRSEGDPDERRKDGVVPSVINSVRSSKKGKGKNSATKRGEITQAKGTSNW